MVNCYKKLVKLSDYCDITGESQQAVHKHLQRHGGAKYGAVKLEGGQWELPDPRSVESIFDAEEPDPKVFPDTEFSKQKNEYYSARDKKITYLKNLTQYKITKGKLVDRKEIEGAWTKKAKQFSELAQKLPEKMTARFGDQFSAVMKEALDDLVFELLNEVAK